MTTAPATYGLFNANGTARPGRNCAARPDHACWRIPAATPRRSQPGSLSYNLSGTQSTDNSILIEKSNGSFWIGLWNEGGTTHTVTVTLPSAASEIEVFDPVTGTSSIASASNASSIAVSLGGDPLLIEVVPATTTGEGSGSGGGTTTSGGSGTSTTPTGPTIALPAAKQRRPETPSRSPGCRLRMLSPPAIPARWCLISATPSGLLGDDLNGTKLAGSGTHSMSVTGTLAQINADLATLTYTAGSNAGGDSIIVDVWDQAGLEATKTLEVTVSRAGVNLDIAPDLPLQRRRPKA